MIQYTQQLKKRAGMLALFLCLTGAGAPAIAQAQTQAQPVTAVNNVNLQDYSGTWYEIASFPAPFQPADCTGTTATYTYNTDGSIKVWNQCYQPTIAGVDKLLRVEGRAVPANAGNSKLKVSFFGPFAGDYWVLALGENYSHALVGAPGRNYLWVLNREPEMNPDTYRQLLNIARQQGFDVSRLRRTPPRSQ